MQESPGGAQYEGGNSHHQAVADVGSRLALGQKRSKETSMSFDPCLWF